MSTISPAGPLASSQCGSVMRPRWSSEETVLNGAAFGGTAEVHGVTKMATSRMPADTPQHPRVGTDHVKVTHALVHEGLLRVAALHMRRWE